MELRSRIHRHHSREPEPGHSRELEHKPAGSGACGRKTVASGSIREAGSRAAGSRRELEHSKPVLEHSRLVPEHNIREPEHSMVQEHKLADNRLLNDKTDQLQLFLLQTEQQPLQSQAR